MPDVLGTFNGPSLILLFTKVFLVSFSLMYLLYSIILVRQTQILNRTVQSNLAGFIMFGAQFHLLFSLLLIVLSIFTL